MAARTRKIRHDDDTRAKIRTSQLVNRLTDHVLGTVEMSATQVTAALGLIRKTLPDLANIDGQIDGNQNVRILSGQPISDEEWEQKYADAGTAMIGMRADDSSDDATVAGRNITIREAPISG